jgi:lysophospholipid acyltransferase (LPLAT)-like uncharacterized protein
MKTGLRYRIAGRAGQLLLDRVMGTARFEVVTELDLRRRAVTGPPVVFLLWHGRLLPLTWLHRGQGIAALISSSADGEYIARVVARWGYHPARGSTSRGCDAGLRDLVRQARAGRSLAITPDGPRGPRQKLKIGALVAAQLTGMPLVPVSAGADRAWWFGGWDRFLVPRPFTRVRVAYGEPYEIPRRVDAGELERHAARLEAELNRLTALVDGRAHDG